MTKLPKMPKVSRTFDPEFTEVTTFYETITLDAVAQMKMVTVHGFKVQRFPAESGIHQKAEL